jgi:hypothetical protein
MKRPPTENESSISHYTVETGDRQDFAICDENYNPLAVRLTLAMGLEDRTERGFRVLFAKGWGRNTARFMVEFGGRIVTQNKVAITSRDPLRIDLETSIVAPMPHDAAEMSSDLEQCVAIGLVKLAKGL